MARRKRMAATAMIAAMAFADAAYGSEICTFDAGYYARLDGHGVGTVDLVRGKGEICVPGYPVQCVPAKRKAVAGR